HSRVILRSHYLTFFRRRRPAGMNMTASHVRSQLCFRMGTKMITGTTSRQSVGRLTLQVMATLNALVGKLALLLPADTYNVFRQLHFSGVLRNVKAPRRSPGVKPRA